VEEIPCTDLGRIDCGVVSKTWRPPRSSGVLGATSGRA